MKGVTNISKTTYILMLVGITLFLTICSSHHVEASKCRRSGKERGKKHPSGSECDTEGELCCIEGKMYKVYKCSPRVTKRTNAYLTLKSFEEGGDGGSPSKCDNRYHPDDTPVVALSTRWFHSGSRCFNNITIRAKGRSVVVMVVDECDSSVGCDAEHDYQPPCANNIVFASRAVWKALGVSREDWGGLDITWSDA